MTVAYSFNINQTEQVQQTQTVESLLFPGTMVSTDTIMMYGVCVDAALTSIDSLESLFIVGGTIPHTRLHSDERN